MPKLDSPNASRAETTGEGPVSERSGRAGAARRFLRAWRHDAAWGGPIVAAIAGATVAGLITWGIAARQHQHELRVLKEQHVQELDTQQRQAKAETTRQITLLRDSARQRAIGARSPKYEALNEALGEYLEFLRICHRPCLGDPRFGPVRSTLQQRLSDVQLYGTDKAGALAERIERDLAVRPNAYGAFVRDRNDFVFLFREELVDCHTDDCSDYAPR